MLPIPSGKKLAIPSPTDTGGIRPETVNHPASLGTTIWVLHQVAKYAPNARTSVFRGWWSFMLPLLPSSAQSHPAARKFLLDASQGIFDGADFGSLSQLSSEDTAEGRSERAEWVPEPKLVRQLLELGSDSNLDRTIVEKLQKSTVELLQTHGHKAGCFGPGLFAQLLPLAGYQGDRHTQSVREACACALLVECLRAQGPGRSKVWSNWVAQYTSMKGTVLQSSAEFLLYLSGCGANEVAGVDRMELQGAIGKVCSWHQSMREAVRGARRVHDCSQRDRRDLKLSMLVGSLQRATKFPQNSPLHCSTVQTRAAPKFPVQNLALVVATVGVVEGAAAGP
eukprot:SAG31_NODE_2320_length_5943_cov_2.466975_3_plen_338_part_00